jgi:GNAT superfamily N-acetyltransferase
MTIAASDIRLVALTAADGPFLWEMLYLALYVPEGQPPPPRDMVGEPDLARYVRGWGRPGDWGLLALDGEKPVGAIWLREWRGREKGYGFVAPEIPELSIALLPGFRNRGLGRRMIETVIAAARERHPGLSLSVVEDSPARRLYERLGFRSTGRMIERSLIMLLDWSEHG